MVAQNVSRVAMMIVTVRARVVAAMGTMVTVSHGHVVTGAYLTLGETVIR